MLVLPSSRAPELFGLIMLLHAHPNLGRVPFHNFFAPRWIDVRLRPGEEASDSTTPGVGFTCLARGWFLSTKIYVPENTPLGHFGKTMLPLEAAHLTQGVPTSLHVRTQVLK